MMATEVRVVDTPEVRASNSWYVSNRPPLLPSPFVKLPLGSVKPYGWPRRQLELMAEGWVERMSELSPLLVADSAWLGGDTEGWEAPAYWLRGFHDLAVLLDDTGLRAEAERWISGVIASQDDDGYFGEKATKAVGDENGRKVADLWPHMMMIDALINHHEHSGDERVLPLLIRFFRWCAELPDDSFIPEPKQGATDWKPFVQWTRAGDMLPHLYWLYNHTEEAWLLDLAERVHRKVRPPESEWVAHHTVDFAQRFREPGTYYAQSADPAHIAETEYWYKQHMDTWGQQPGGMYAADEFIRPGKTGPKQGCETCSMVELNKSFHILGKITGQALYADRCEDIQFNSYPASQTPDMRAVHYLTAANQPQLDRSANHDYYNERYHKKNHIVYSPDPRRYRCCQYNLAMGWPCYVDHFWMASADNGLVAWLYGASQVRARAGEEGVEVTIREETDYPFDGTVRMTLKAERDVNWPLYLRVPSWCTDFRVSVNGTVLSADPKPGQYVVVERTWADGDTVELTMPMEISLTQWEKSANSVTVNRGPLSFSLKIGEDWRRCGGTEKWPEWEVMPTTPWNYGLIVDRADPRASFEVIERGQVPDQPWASGSAPLEIRAKGKRIPSWKLLDDTVTDLQPSPVKSAEPEEEITLIPMGCARLRISCFPTVSEAPSALEWKPRLSHDLYPLLPPHSMVQHGLGAGDMGWKPVEL